MTRRWIPAGAPAAVLLTLSGTPTRGSSLERAANVSQTSLHTSLHRLRTAGYATRTGTRHAATWTRTPTGDTIAPLAQAGLTPNDAHVLNVVSTEPRTCTALTHISAHNRGPRWPSLIHAHLTNLALADLVTINDHAYTLTPAGQALQATTRRLFGVPIIPADLRPQTTAAPTQTRRAPLKRRILQQLAVAPAQATDLHAQLPGHTLASIRTTLSTMRRAGLVTRTRTGHTHIWREA